MFNRMPWASLSASAGRTNGQRGKRAPNGETSGRRDSQVAWARDKERSGTLVQMEQVSEVPWLFSSVASM